MTFPPLVIFMEKNCLLLYALKSTLININKIKIYLQRRPSHPNLLQYGSWVKHHLLLWQWSHAQQTDPYGGEEESRKNIKCCNKKVRSDVETEKERKLTSRTHGFLSH